MKQAWNAPSWTQGRRSLQVVSRQHEIRAAQLHWKRFKTLRSQGTSERTLKQAGSASYQFEYAYAIGPSIDYLYETSFEVFTGQTNLKYAMYTMACQYRKAA
jgi:hypothetical protein